MISDPIQVLIITYNRLLYLQQCMDSLYKSKYPIVINIWDNGSNDGTKEWIRNEIKEQRIKGEFFDSPKNVGTSVSKNKGINALGKKSDHILLSDDDMFYYPGCLEKAVEVYNYITNKKLLNIGIMGFHAPWSYEHYATQIRMKRMLFEELQLSVHEVKITPPNSWLLYYPAFQETQGFWLPDDRIMGYSARFIPQQMRDHDYHIVRIHAIRGHIYRPVVHCDYRSCGKNFCDFYERSGYNVHRKKHKGFTRPDEKVPN